MSDRRRISKSAWTVFLLISLLCMAGCLGSRSGEWTLVGRWVTAGDRMTLFGDGTFEGNLGRREISGRYQLIDSSGKFATASADSDLPYAMELELLSRNTLRLQITERSDDINDSPYEEEPDADGRRRPPRSQMIVFSRSED